jgi:hypothetical protein
MNYKFEPMIASYAEKLKTLKVGDYSYEGLLIKFLLDLQSESVIEFVE